MQIDLPEDWRTVLQPEMEKPYFAQLCRFVDTERREGTVWPAESDVFNAFRFTPLAEVRVVILGQDPYHGVGQAHGLCFSVQPGTPPPPSLVNIFKELRDDIGCRIPTNGCLSNWARQGCLMLNTVLTVRENEANSHKYRGWEKFTDAALAAVNALDRPVVFLLWGNAAIKRGSRVDTKRHTVISSAHPSPLSAYNGFFNSRPFSAVNAALAKHGGAPINWAIADE